MGNFLEDFLYGTPNPRTGETNGGIPAIADTLWPFEGTGVSTAIDSTVGQVVTAPLRANVGIAMGGLTALDYLFSYGLYRPLSTAIQAGATPSNYNLQRGAVMNPLYRDGIQFQDFVDMWNASEYISPMRALTQWSWFQGGYANDGSYRPGNVEAIRMSRALDNPYPTAGGMDQQSYEAAWDSSVLGTVVSGTGDAMVGFVGIPGLGRLASLGKNAAGLTSTINGVRDLTSLRTAVEGHEVWVASKGAQGKFNISGQYVQDLAKETNIAKIAENPLLTRWTRSGSFYRDELADIISQTDDVATIRELILADRGDTLALGRLFQAAPDRIWSLTDMNEKLAAQFAEGGQYFPTQDAARVLKTTFDSAVQRDEWWSSVRDLFMSGRLDEPAAAADAATGAAPSVIPGTTIPATSARGKKIVDLETQLKSIDQQLTELASRDILNGSKVDALDSRYKAIQGQIDDIKRQPPQFDEFATTQTSTSDGKFNAVRGAGSDFVPLGTTGMSSVSDVVGQAERWFKGLVADARINKPNEWIEVALGPVGSRPLTTLLFWSGSRQPLNIVSYTRQRPTEIVDEMLSYSRSSRVLRNRNWIVSRTDANTGEPVQLSMRDWQWREQAIERLAKAKNQGDTAVDQTVNELQNELISVIVNRYNVTPEDAIKVTNGMGDWLKMAQEQVARDGYFYDDVMGQATPDPEFIRQLASSRILMPLDDLDWALRNISSTRYAKRGRGTRRAMRISANALDLIFKVFRTNVLFKPGYTPKNSFAEPGVSAIMADASLLAPDGLASTLKRFEINNDRRMLSLKYGIIDRLPLSAARRDMTAEQRLADEYATLSARLGELEAHVQDLETGSPAARSKWLEAALNERRLLNRQLDSVERELSISNAEWSEVVEVPTFAELSHRVEVLKSALLDNDFPVTAGKQIDEINAAAAARAGSQEAVGNLSLRLQELQARRADLIVMRDSMYMSEGRRAAQRDLKNPAKNKRRDFVDPDNPEARTAPDWIEQLARVNDPRSTESLSRIPARGDAERRIEAVIRSIAYVDEQIAATQAGIRVAQRAGSGARVLESVGLTAVEQDTLNQLQALLRARENLTPEQAQALLDDLTRQLDQIRQDSWVASPDVGGRIKALQDALAKVDEQRATLSARIAKRKLARERLAKRELSGEKDYVRNIGGVEYTIPAPFGTVDNYGTAMRAEVSANLSNAQELTGGVDPLGLSRSRNIGSRWQRTAAGDTIKPSEPRYWDELAYIYNRHVMGDDFAKLLLMGKSDSEIMAWFRTPAGDAYRKAMGWRLEDLGDRVVGFVKARPLAGQGKTDARIETFKNGIIPTNRRLLEQYFPDPELRRQMVNGSEMTPGELQTALGGKTGLSPIYGPGLEFVGNPLARVNTAVNNGLDLVWDNLASKPESRFARYPFFQREYLRQMDRMIRIRQDQGLPITGVDIRAMKSQAESRALKETENSFYNVRRMASPVFAQRYLLGFASAAWNTVYRYLRLAYRNPGRAMLIAWGWQNFIGSVGVDDNGEKVEDWKDAKSILITIPAVVDAPIDPHIKITTDTFNFLTQENGYIPVIQQGISTLLHYKPDMEDWLKKRYPDIYNELFAYGTGTDPEFSILGFPLDPATSSYQRKLKILLQGPSNDEYLQSAVLDYNYRLFEWSKDGQQGPMPKFEDSAKNAAEFYKWSAGISMFTSGVTGINPEGQGLREEARKIMSKHEGDYLAYQAELYSTFGPEAYFLDRSTSTSRSAMPATTDAYNILQDNASLAKTLLNMSTDNPKISVDLLFLDEMTYTQEERSQAIYDWQFNNTLPGDDQTIRERNSPEAIEREYQKAKSWAVWSASIANRDAELMRLGKKTLSPNGVTAQLYTQWNAFVDQFTNDPKNASMVEELGLRNTGTTGTAIRSIRALLSNTQFMRSVGTSPTYSNIRKYMGELEIAQAQFEEQATNPELRKAFAIQWDSYVRDKFLPGAGNFATYYERYLAGRDLTEGDQLLERTLNIPGFPLPAAS